MRTKNPVTVLGPDGRPLAGASVMTRDRPTNDDANDYAAEVGGAAGDNPAISDAHGKVVQWCERGQYASTITADGLDPWVEEWDSSPGGDSGVDANWIDDDVATAGLLAVRQADGTIGWAQAGTAAIADDAITNAKLAPNAVGTTEVIDDAITPPKLGRFFHRQRVAAQHLDNVAGAQAIQGFADCVVAPTRAAAIYRVMLRIRSISADAGFDQAFTVRKDGADWTDVYASIRTDGADRGGVLIEGYHSPGNLTPFTLRPYVNHAAGSGWLTLSAPMHFVVEEVD